MHEERISGGRGAVALGILVFLACFCSTVQGLKCYTCQSVEWISGSSNARNKMSSKSDPHCENAGTIFGTKLETCQYGLNCGYIKTEATGKIGVIFGDTTTVRVLVRGCMLGTGTNEGCSQGVDILKSAVNTALGFLGKIGGWQVDGKVCYCDSNGCIAGGCASGVIPIAGQCFPWFWIAGTLVAAGLAIMLFIACCCWCRRKTTARQTFVLRQQPEASAYLMSGNF